MSNYPRRLIESIETLRMIEEAVTEDSMKNCPAERKDLPAFVEAVRHRVANVVQLFCFCITGE